MKVLDLLKLERVPESRLYRCIDENKNNCYFQTGIGVDCLLKRKLECDSSLKGVYINEK